MRYRSKGILLTLAVGGLIAGGGAPALAAETANSEFLIVQSDDVITDDLYAGAVKVSVEGVIDGDLVAFAGEEVVIDGTVTGSVLAISPRVTVKGTVGGSVRVSAGSLTVSGEVGGDIVAAAYEVELGESSVVAGDVLAWAWRTSALGAIGQDLSGSQRSLSLGGSVAGDVDVSVGRLTVSDTVSVGGDLGYRSTRQAMGLEKAEVGGTVVRKSPLPPNLRIRALGLFGRFLLVLFLTIGALAVAYGWPKRTVAAIESARRSPVRSWVYGAPVVLSPLLLALATALLFALAPAAAGFPLLAVLAPVVLASAGLVMALSLVAGVPAVGRLGKALFVKLNLHGAVLAGSIIAGAVWFVPLAGWLVPLLVLPLGLGAWILSWRREEADFASEVGAEAQT